VCAVREFSIVTVYLKADILDMDIKYSNVHFLRIGPVEKS
jgi:hypothetical protein